MSEIDDSTRQRKCRCGHAWLAVFPQDREHSCRQNYEQRITDLEQQLKTAKEDIEQAHMAGQSECGCDPSFSLAQEYANNLEGK